MTQNHVNMMLVLFVEIKLVITQQSKQILQTIAKHKMELTAITISKTGFIRLKIIYLFRLLYSHIIRHSIVTQ